MAQKLSIKGKKLYRAMRDHGVSKKKAKGVLSDLGGAGKSRHRPHPVKAVRGSVHNLRKHG